MQSLKMLVVAVLVDLITEVDRVEIEKWLREVRQADQRLYMVERHSRDFRDEWENEMRGGETVWDRAIRYTM
jgi:hypothetical protein